MYGYDGCRWFIRTRWGRSCWMCLRNWATRTQGVNQNMFRNVCLLSRTFETDVVFVIAGPREAQWKTTIHTRRVSLNTPADLSPRMHSDACLLCLSLWLPRVYCISSTSDFNCHFSFYSLSPVWLKMIINYQKDWLNTETVKWVGPRKSQIK